MDVLMALIADVKAAKAAGATGAPLTAALEFQRHGQFYLDFVESENSNGFHAPQEAARILGEAIDYLRQGQLALRPAPAHESSAVRRLRTAWPTPCFRFRRPSITSPP